MASGCTSIVDSKKISGLQQLGVWKTRATNLKEHNRGDRALYQKAKIEVDTYITVPLDSQIGDASANIFGGKVDLSAEAIPSSVATAAGKYFDSAEVFGGMGSSTGELALAIASWAVKEANGWAVGKRQESAKDLRDKLKMLQWESWNP